MGQVTHSLAVGRFTEKKKRGKNEKERKKPVQRADGMVVFTKVKSTETAYPVYPDSRHYIRT